MPFGPGGGGGGVGGLVKLGSATVTGSAGPLDTGAAGITAGHGTLLIYVLAQSASAGGSEAFGATLNGDTSAIYDSQYFQSSGSNSGGSALGATSWSAGGLVHGTGGTANYASAVIFTFPFYDSTTFNKSGWLQMETADASAANTRLAILGLGYRSTSAISQFTFTCTSDLSIGSTMTWYGTE